LLKDKFSSTYLFADDAKNFREIREENDEQMLQADLDSLQSWSDKWLLKFHRSKCKVMLVANKCVDKGTKHYYLYDLLPRIQYEVYPNLE
jgi:hypothetical protein